MRYRDAGVDVARNDVLKRALGEMVRTTWSRGVRTIPGGFAGVTRWPGGGTQMLAATMDGVGTKLHLALAAGRVGDAAADLVYHCADDLLVHGAQPLAFLDYVAQARLDAGVVQAVVEGLSRACREVGAALLGGETAEMPDTYLERVVDVAGCMLGVVEERELLDGSAVAPGDRLLGLGSLGLHTNGYSLARRVLSDSGRTLADPLPGGGGTLGEALLAPHRWYGPALAPVIRAGRVHALAHVTGGGIAGNLVRVLPEGCRGRVRARAWTRPPLFRWLIETGRVPEDDARETFNLGIGMIVVCAPAECDALASDLQGAGETVADLGEIVPGERGVEWVEGR
ncbi:MAG TPA: phosphoribosylformylglycinamidine cyclo-ligase [Candidatus Eisenbacteria bacterium]|nr:phosphoribosylformylglycinamidine cyclo-ligase [Candidatus Eisenbacteria bacterium]